MPRDNAIIFGDLLGKLDIVRVACEKCGRSGQYRLDRLIAQRGREAKVMDFLADVSADCPRRVADKISDRCGAKCPDLARALSAPPPASRSRG